MHMPGKEDYQKYLRRVVWFIRLVIVVILLIPSSIPAILLFLAKYTLAIVDPENIVINFVSETYWGVLNQFPVIIQELAVTIIITKIVLLYLIVIKLLHPGESISFVMKRQFTMAYNRYVKIPN